jgi:type IV pilus assembly protein PilB
MPTTQPSTHALTLTRILAQAGVVTPRQVEEAIARQRDTGLRSGELLVQMGAATEEDIGWALAQQLGLTFIDPRPDSVDHDLIRTFPEQLLRRFVALPLVVEDDVVAIAFADPTDYQSISEITLAAGRSLSLAVATPTAIGRALDDVFGVGGSVDGSPTNAKAASEVEKPKKAASDVEKFKKGMAEMEKHRTGSVFLLERLDEARRAGAAEIHLLPHQDRLNVWHRIGGKLAASKSQSSDTLVRMLEWIESLGGPALAPDQRLASGRVECPSGATTIDLFVSLLRQPSGICVTIEPMAPAFDPGLEWLGFDAVDLSQLREVLSAPAGLGLIAGPRGSGGSTTLEAMATELERETRRCVRWNAGAGKDSGKGDTTALGLAAAITHSADVVALDDTPVDGVRAILGPAGSGRWVIARVEAVDTFSLLHQLASTPLERVALAERLRFVVQQRRPWRARETTSSKTNEWTPRRCSVFEVLIVQDGLRDSLRAGDLGEVMRMRAFEAGFTPLARRLQVLVTAGLVTQTEAARLVV